MTNETTLQTQFEAHEMLQQYNKKTSWIALH